MKCSPEVFRRITSLLRFFGTIVGWGIIILACGLITDVVVIYLWVILPLVAPPGTWGNTLLFHLGCILGFGIFFNYFCALGIDPGVVPRQYGSNAGEARNRPCQTCTTYKPPRTRHCSVCGRCVLKMDHHCPWINGCVGHNNNRYFFSFLCYLMAGTFFTTSQSYYVFRTVNEGPNRELITSSIVVFTTILGALIFVAMVLFVGWNGYLLLTNQTAIEFQFNKFDPELKGMRNVYDLGRWSNIVEVFQVRGDAFLRGTKRNARGLRLLAAMLWICVPSLIPLESDGRSYPRWDSGFV